jgi:hypothetical protein
MSTEPAVRTNTTPRQVKQTRVPASSAVTRSAGQAAAPGPVVTGFTRRSTHSISYLLLYYLGSSAVLETVSYFCLSLSLVRSCLCSGPPGGVDFVRTLLLWLHCWRLHSGRKRLYWGEERRRACAPTRIEFSESEAYSHLERDSVDPLYVNANPPGGPRPVFVLYVVGSRPSTKENQHTPAHIVRIATVPSVLVRSTVRIQISFRSRKLKIGL